jgi:hypothetical protein
VPLLVLPAGLPQPISTGTAVNYADFTDAAGNFAATQLADGEYLITVGARGDIFSSNLTETVTLIDGETFSLPALRVAVSGGAAVTGIVITLVYPTAGPPSDEGFGGPLSPVAELPAAGSGAGSSDTSGYIGAAVAGMALLALAGGVIWRMRAARR